MGSNSSKYDRNAKPELVPLLKALEDIDVKWFDIGRALNINPHELRSLEPVRKGTRRNRKRLKRVLKYWKLNGDPKTVTWEAVIAAVSGPLIHSYSTVQNLEKLCKFNIEHVRCAIPDKKDLIKVLNLINDDNLLTKFVKRISPTLPTADQDELISTLHNENKTWGEIINAASPLRQYYVCSCKWQLCGRNCTRKFRCCPCICCCYENLSDVIENFLSQSDVYIKYKSRLPAYSKELDEALKGKGYVKICVSKVVVHGPLECANEIIKSVQNLANPLESTYWDRCVNMPSASQRQTSSCQASSCRLCCCCRTSSQDNMSTPLCDDRVPLPTTAIAPSTSTYYMKGEDDPVGVYMVQVVNTHLRGLASLLDIAPALLRYTPVNVLTYDIKERLDDMHAQARSYGIEEVVCSGEDQISNIELLENSFRSLALINPRSQPHNIHVKFSNEKPHFAVVSTSCDETKQPQDTLQENEKILRESLAIDQYCSSNDIVYNEQKMTFPIHFINDDSSTQSDLARKIHDTIIKCHIKADIPIQWLKFKLQLDKLDECIISRKQCKELVANLEETMLAPQSMDQDIEIPLPTTQSIPTPQESEMESLPGSQSTIQKIESMPVTQLEPALMLFHDLTILSYFPNILPDVVFLNPQLLIDTLADLTAEIQQEKVSAESGVFKRSSLCNKSFSSEVFTVENFLHLMQRLYIIAPLSEKDHYFLPSALPPAALTDLDKEREPFMKNVPPLIMTWDMKPIPSCLFFALAIELLQNLETQIELMQPSKCTSISQQHVQYRNAIRLICKNIGGRILLVDNMKWFEVYYDGPEKKCSKIRSVVLDSIAKVTDVLNFVASISGMPEECFYCPKHDVATTQPSTPSMQPSTQPATTQTSTQPATTQTSTQDATTETSTQPSTHAITQTPTQDATTQTSTQPSTHAITQTPTQDATTQTSTQPSTHATTQTSMQPLTQHAATQTSTQEAWEKHLCSLNEDKTMLTCQYHGVIDSISNYRWWFNTEVKNITQEPDHFALLNLLADKASYWHEIGLALNVNNDLLRALKSKPLPSVLKLQEVLEIWRDNPKPTYPYTWKTIIEAMESPILGNKSKAEEIRRYITRLELAEPEHTNMQEMTQ